MNNNNNNFFDLSPVPLTIAFIAGLIDGEGSFGLYLRKDPKYGSGYQVRCEFAIVLHAKDRALLESIKLFFNGAGGLDKHGKLSVKYRVSSQKDIQTIINHLDKYPLITQKRADYLLFKSAFEIISRKEHLTPEGFREILSIKAAINLGLTDSLTEVYPNIVSKDRPKVEDLVAIDPA